VVSPWFDSVPADQPCDVSAFAGLASKQCGRTFLARHPACELRPKEITIMTAGAERAVLPGRGDLIRIVPLYVPEETVRPLEGVAPAVSPHLSYRGGPLLANVEVFTVFWGAAWQDAPLSDLATKLMVSSASC
jgi:hypothetical protein